MLPFRNTKLVATVTKLLAPTQTQGYQRLLVINKRFNFGSRWRRPFKIIIPQVDYQGT